MKRIIISSYFPNKSYNPKILQSLKFAAKDRDAELMLIPCKGFTKDDIETRDELLELTKDKSFKLNRKLSLSNLKLNINTIDPINGLERLAAMTGNLVVPFARHRFKMIPRSLKHHKTPTGIWCTGSISNPDYSFVKEAKNRLFLEQYHQCGALYVEIINERKFNIRQLQIQEDGTFHDLDTKYSPNKKEHAKIEAIVLGDLHPPFIDLECLDKTTKFLREYKLLNIIYSDIFDASSISHHLEGKYIDKATNHVPSLKDELLLTSNILKQIRDTSLNSNHIIVKSNHDQHLDRYINEFRFKEDYTNLELGLEIALHYVKIKKHNDMVDLLENAIKLADKSFSGFKFLKELDTCSIAGIEISNHGHAGNNGAQGNPKSQGLLFGGKCVTAHTHSPEITIYGNSVTGTMSLLVMPYTKDSGGSNWMHSHVLIYTNGTMSHLHMI